MNKHLNFVIRKVNRSDTKHLTHFFERNNVIENTRNFHPFPLNATTAYRITSTLQHDHYYVAMSGDQVVGFCMLRGWNEGYAIPSFGILVDREFQRLGLGKKLTEFAIKEAERLKCPQIKLSVYASNTIALSLYRSFDFVEYRRESVIIMGTSDEKIIMFKEL